MAVRRGAAQSAIALVERYVKEVVLIFKLCDPGMGSGHFLVNAADQITDLIVSFLAEIPDVEGMASPTTCEPNHWRRLITRHCLYGVDVNPLAVHLAKLSLWLNCFARDHKLTFLDHHLRCGNSLIGIRRLSQLENIPERSKDETKKHQDKKRQGKLPFPEELTEAFRRAVHEMESISNVDEDDTDRQKDIHEEVRRETIKPLMPLAYLFTAYLMDDTVKQEDYRDLFLRLAQGASPASMNELKLHEQMKVLAKRHHFFHWPLEFPNVFTDDSGFDATVGNPPWDIVKTNSQEFFSDYDADFRKYSKPQAKKVVDELMKRNPIIAKKWNEYCVAYEMLGNYFREPDAYSAIGKGHINTYKLFLERFFALLKPGGRLGIVAPSGLYTDQGCQPLRELLFNKSRIVCLYGFENRRAIFNIHRSFKFILFCTEKSGATESFRCAFMEHDPERLEAIDADALFITSANIKRFSPDSLSIMEFSNQKEIDIASTIYEQHPFLGEYLKNKWGAAFQREFNITDDSDLFIPKNGISNKDLLPLWEGKQIWILTNGFSEPTSWVRREDAARKTTTKNTRLIYRALASNTNERTLISTVIPASFPTGNSLNVCPLPPRIAVTISAIAGSFIMDWLLRGKVTTNVNMFIIEQLPIVDIENSNNITREITNAILSRGCRLICTTSIYSEIWANCFSHKWISPDFWYPREGIMDYGPAHEQELRNRLSASAIGLTPEWTTKSGLYNSSSGKVDTGDRAQLRAEIDAYVAHLYGLTRDDFAYILDTFPVLKRKEEQAFGEFMSKRKCLEEYDRTVRLL